MWICVLDILISVSTLVEPEEKETQRISSLSSNLYQKAECRSVGIWNLHWRRCHWPLIPAICLGGQFRRTPESVNTVPTSWSGPSADTLTPTVTLVHFPHLVVTSRCDSDYALLCWNNMRLIVDLKCTGLMVRWGLLQKPSLLFLNVCPSTQYFFGLLKLLAVPWGFAKLFASLLSLKCLCSLLMPVHTLWTRTRVFSLW